MAAPVGLRVIDGETSSGCSSSRIRASKSAIFSSRRRERVTSAPVAYSQSSGRLFARQRLHVGLPPSHFYRQGSLVRSNTRMNCVSRVDFRDTDSFQFPAGKTSGPSVERTAAGAGGGRHVMNRGSVCRCVGLTENEAAALIYDSAVEWFSKGRSSG